MIIAIWLIAVVAVSVFWYGNGKEEVGASLKASAIIFASAFVLTSIMSGGCSGPNYSSSTDHSVPDTFNYEAAQASQDIASERTGVSTKAPDPVYDPSLTADQLTMARKAYAVFCRVAQPLMGKYSEDIESIEISRGFDRNRDLCPEDNGCLDYRCRDYGWNKQIYIKVKIKDKADKIPFDTYAWGNIEHYYLGGPKNPGITLSKHPQLCGVEDAGDDEAFMSVPELAFIK